MAADDPSGARPGPVVLRIKLRYDDVDAMVQRFAPNVGRSGLFLPTRSLQPIGTEVKFELRLANDTPVLVGVGRVKSVKAPDPAHPRAAFGMAIELMRVTREAREVIIRMIERRRVLGLPEVAIPMPEDVEAARRADMDSHPRADTGGVVRDALQAMASAPVAEQVITGPRALSTGPVLLVPEDPARPITGPVATVPADPVTAPRDSAPSVAVPPRPLTGPLTSPVRNDSSRPVPAVLAPEPPRPRRPKVAEMIARATETSGATAAAVTVEGLDEQVDVERALVRARTLAGGDVDAELAALKDASAAPLEISIEAASAELARQLGGAPIATRERKPRWAPPPAVATEPNAPVAAEVAAPVDAAVPAQAAPDEPPPAGVEPVTDVAGEPMPATLAPLAESPKQRAETEGFRYDSRRDDSDDDVFAATAPGTVTAIDPAALAIAEPAAVAASEPPAEAPVDAPAMIDDDADLSAFERALDAAIIHTGQTAKAPEPAEPLDDDDAEPLDSMDLEAADEERGERTAIGAFAVDPAAFQHHGQPTVPDERAGDAAGLPGGDEPEGELIDDVDVLAEADADDADLLSADGERDASGSHELAPALPGPYEDSYDANAQGYDPNAAAGYDANAAAGYDPHAQAYDPHAPAYDPNVAAYDPNAAAYDPNAAAYDPNAAAYDPNAAAYDPNAAAYDPNAPYDPNAYARADAQRGYDANAYAAANAQRGYDANAYAAARAQDPAYYDPDAAAPPRDYRGHGAYPPDDLAEPNEFDQGEYSAQTAYPPAPNTGSFDFASRLDLGEDESGVGSRPSPVRYPGYHDQVERASSYDPPSSSYTFAETAPPRDSGMDFDEPHGFVGQEGQRRARRASSEPAPAPAPVARPGRRPPTDYDLESALEQLDPDLDVSASHAAPASGAEPAAPGPRLPGLPPSRAPARAPTSATRPPPHRAKPVTLSPNVIKRGTTPAPEVGKPARPSRPTTEDDGILIDFDDED